MVSNLHILAASSGLGTLGVNGTDFLIEAITFILGYLVLRKWAFGPIIKVLRERRETINKGVALGEEMQKQKQKLEEQVSNELTSARQKADTILSDASSEAKEIIHQAETDALAKADAILEEAKVLSNQEMARAKVKLEGEIINLVSEATEVLVGEKVDPKKDSVLISKALAGRVER
ncbi:MAG: F0F1 ATP synthase subunit B [Candidatus Saccharimonadales bacterium]